MNTSPSLGPRVSVIVPVYATARFVAEALDSVLAQTYADYEIILVNDGSPDSQFLSEVLERYWGQITYIVQENRGSSGARNSALRVAKGEYVAMLDSDDRWHPEYLASQLGVLDADPSIDVVYPDAVRLTAQGRETTRYSDEYPVGGEISFLRVLSRECQIYGEVAARRRILLDVGLYDEELKSGEDFELWLRVLKAGGRIAYNDRVLAYYRTRPGSHTSNDKWLIMNVLKVLEKVGQRMELTVAERSALDRQRLTAEAQLNLLEGKQALIDGDPRTAITKLTDAAHYLKGWKIHAAVIALKIAPDIVLRLYGLRQHLQRVKDRRSVRLPI